MQILGFNATIIPIATVIGTCGSILLSYLVAVRQGHVKPLPYTDITHCTIHYPEYYIARIGFPFGCVMISIFLNLIVYYIRYYMNLVNQVNAYSQLKDIQKQQVPFEIKNFLSKWSFIEQNIKKHHQIKQFEELKCPQYILYIGYISAALFLLSICVITESDLNWFWHSFGAVGFFILFYLDFLIIGVQYKKIWQYYPNFITQFSYNIKMSWLGSLKVIIAIVLVTYLRPNLVPDWFGNALEWGLVLMLAINAYSYAIDFRNMKLEFQKQVTKTQDYFTQVSLQEINL